MGGFVRFFARHRESGRANRGNVVPMMIALQAATPQLPRTKAVADQVVAVGETDSTNALAARMIGDGSLTLPERKGGTLAVGVVATDWQSAGRGRNGHTWISQPGRCSTMSYAVRIPRAIATDESVNGWLQMIAGLVTLDALNGMIKEYGAAPNRQDVFWSSNGQTTCSATGSSSADCSLNWCCCRTGKLMMMLSSSSGSA